MGQLVLSFRNIDVYEPSPTVPIWNIIGGYMQDVTWDFLTLLTDAPGSVIGLTAPALGSQMCTLIGETYCSHDGNWKVYVKAGLAALNLERRTYAHELFGHVLPNPNGDVGHDTDPGYPGGPGDFPPFQPGGDALADELAWMAAAWLAGDYAP